jgi:hypothetical protein
VLLDAAQDLGAVDLAQDVLGGAQAREREGHAPAVAVEHRQRVEVDVAVVDAGVQANVVAFSHKLRCVSCTPLGRAVVPLV